MSDGKKTYKLLYPFDYGEDRIEELKIKKPRAKDIRDLPVNMDDAKMEIWIDLLCKLTDQPPSVIDRLELADVMKCVEMLASFLAGGPETSTKL